MDFDLKEEINSRPYSRAMRMACQQAEKTPYEFLRNHFAGVQIETTIGLPNEEVTQEQLIDGIERLGQAWYKHLTNPKHIELVNTIRPQWHNKIMTPGARDFALRVLGMLENMEKNSHL